MNTRFFTLGSVTLAALLACSDPLTTREKGAVIGTVGGAAAGGIIGGAVGHPGTGAAIGGAVGLGSGALIGDRLQSLEKKQTDLDRQIQENENELERQRREIEALKKRSSEMNNLGGGVSVSRVRFWLCGLLWVLAGDPFGYTVSQTVAAAEVFPPQIDIREGVTASGFPYIAGGIGSDERNKMEEMGKDFNLKIAFAVDDGSFLANIDLVIEDAKGQLVIATKVPGPWFFIRLTTGTYTIKATYKQVVKTIASLKVQQGKELRRTFHWKAASPSDQTMIMLRQ